MAGHQITVDVSNEEYELIRNSGQSPYSLMMRSLKPSRKDTIEIEVKTVADLEKLYGELPSRTVFYKEEPEKPTRMYAAPEYVAAQHAVAVTKEPKRRRSASK